MLNVRVSREDDNAHGIAVGLAFSARPNAYQRRDRGGNVINRGRIHPETRDVDHFPVCLCSRIKDRIRVALRFDIFDYAWSRYEFR